VLPNFSIFAPVRTVFAKILFCLAVGLLFSHQFIGHHHHEEAEITSNHQDRDDADHQQDHFPAHQIAHIFSFDNTGGIAKATILQFYFERVEEFIFRRTVQFKSKKEYVEIRPPVSGYYKYFSLRAPPSIS
jgi:hypothetical protein